VDTNNNEERDSTRADELTRRRWILRLGEFVALAGVSGFVPELAALAAQQAKITALPPGLYEPSQDHLVHALSGGGKNWTPPAGSETEYALPTTSAYQPQFFSPQVFKVMTRMVEIILGNVDRPALSQATEWLDAWLHSAGAVREAARRLDPLHRILAVAYYGEASVREVETADPQSIARAGLHALHELSLQTYSREFLALGASEQIELLTSGLKGPAESPLRQVLGVTRTEAIRGYYTSAAGLKELDYRGNAYYGESPGCEDKS
jgi:hypothetical protein